MKTIADVTDFLNQIGASTNPECDDPLAFVMRHYQYLAELVATKIGGVQDGEYFCIRDTNGGVIWEGTVTKKILDK